MVGTYLHNKTSDSSRITDTRVVTNVWNLLSSFLMYLRTEVLSVQNTNFSSSRSSFPCNHPVDSDSDNGSCELHSRDCHLFYRCHSRLAKDKSDVSVLCTSDPDVAGRAISILAGIGKMMQLEACWLSETF